MTLVEAMLCIVLLGMTATAISGLYVSGLQSIDGTDDLMLVDSHLRSQMEELISRPFNDVLTEGSGVSFDGMDVDFPTVNWTAVLHDLDGDGAVELSAMLLTVSVPGRSLSSIVVDHGRTVVKIP